MKRFFSSLMLGAVMLSAQTPSASLAQRVEAETQRLDTLLQTDPKAALAEAQLLIPNPLPAFDKSTILTTRASLMDQLAIVQIKFFCGRAAREAGQWELSLGLFKEASSIALVAQDNIKSGLTLGRKQWSDAVADAKTKIAETEPKLADIDNDPRFKDLDAKKERTLGENIEYESYMNRKADLVQPLGVWRKNIEIAPKAMETFDKLEQEPNAYIEACNTNAKKMKDRLDAEQKDRKRFDELARNPIINSKRLTGLRLYIFQGMKDLTQQKVDKTVWLLNLNRFLQLDPSNKDALKKLDWANGVVPQPKKSS